MMEENMDNIQIGWKDVLWNYTATILKVGVGLILLPFILHSFSKDTVAIWTVYSIIITLSTLFDFGFNPSFARNVSYVVSGVRELKNNGFQVVEATNKSINYELFKGLISAMQWFYTRIALLLFVVLITLGTYYMYLLLRNYSDNHVEVYISWFILCAINTYSLYTLYYEAMMNGMGLIKRAKQIMIIGEVLYLIVAVVLIIMHFNLIAIVSAQTLSVITRRQLLRRTLYTPSFKKSLNSVVAKAKEEYVKPIFSNAIKLGINGIGNFLIRRLPVIIASLFLPLSDIASYGITIQIVWIITEIANVYPITYQPQIAQYRIENNLLGIKKCYRHSFFLMLAAFTSCGLGLLLLGDWVLEFIKSETHLLPKTFSFVIMLVYLLERNQFIACDFLLTKNEVPFFKATLFASIFTLILLFLFLIATPLGLWSMILAQGIAQSIYSNWKWPLEVLKELHK